MNTNLLPLFFTTITAAAAAFILFPLLIKWSPYLKLVDMPDGRKKHKAPVPAIGGLLILLSLFASICFSSALQHLLLTHRAFSFFLVVLCIVGIIDDRMNVSSLLRLLVQLGCALALAHEGIRLTSMHGFLGIYAVPLVLQYAITVIIITGLVNAFNLIDGIDGLAGGMGLINLVALSVIAYFLRLTVWLYFLLPFAAALSVFLKYNWKPAKLFMGDGGSLVLGYITGSLGIFFVEKSYLLQPLYTPAIMVAITACTMLPVIDTMRLFYARIKRGRSPFSADRNHLHHLLLRHYLSHDQAAKRLLSFQGCLIVLSFVLIPFFSLSVVIISQVLIVLLYTWLVQMSSLFHRWYRFIRRMETVS